MALSLDKVKSIIKKNEKGILPEKLEDFSSVKDKKVDFENAADQGDLKRFD